MPALLLDHFLMFEAEILNDLEAIRIANSNRLATLTRVGLDADGKTRGFGLNEDHPSVAQLAALVADLATAEKRAQRNLERTMRAHPLGPWLADCRGIGDKQGARLLAAIGDPYWHNQRDNPRSVSELWSYCGMNVWIDENGMGVAPYRSRNRTLNWSPDARKRVWLIAESVMKARGEYRAAYDAAKAKYAGALHDLPCRRCGPSGHPAEVGSPLKDGHVHARALRAARQVKMTGDAITLDAMQPFERRAIHLALEGDPEVTSSSIGEEPERRVVVSLRKPAAE